MKTTFRKLGSLLLALCLIAALLPCAAFADEYLNEYADGTTGMNFMYYWSTPNNSNITSAYVEEGLFPDGISMGSDGSTIQVAGIPSGSGNYDVRLNITTEEGTTYILDLDIVINGKTETTYQSTLTGKVGTAVSGWAWATTDGANISNVYVEDGSLPAGLTIPIPGSNAFQIEGTPTSAGTTSCTIRVETYDNIFHIQLNCTIDGDEFAITKSPTSESTNEGGSATFIATATNYNYVEWLLIKNGSTMATYQGENNTSFNGCNVITYKDSDKEYLVLKNIPSSMNGYTIQARFTNTAKSSSILTQSCSLNVTATALKTPTITTQPSASTQTVGNSTVLSVAASDPNGGTLKYQWYSNTSASTSGGTIINGATSASYTAPQTEGTLYYYCSITSVKDGKTSTAVTSTPVAVTYTSASPSPSPSASPDPSASPSPSVSPTTVPSSGNSTKGNSSGLLILLIVLILLSAAALIFLVLYMRKKNVEEAAEEDVSEAAEITTSRVQLMKKWTCPECGSKNRASARFCSECGAANPNTNLKKK